MAIKQAIKIITIDGPAGAGKSTVAKELARRLNFSYLDTGAMYRALTLKALRLHVDLENEGALVELAKKTTIDLEPTSEGSRVLLDGEDVSNEIRTIEVTNKTSFIARAPRVREIMVEWQRIIGSKKSVVVEGRDVGTVVFPQATNKFYLDADFNERSRRRIEELKAKGIDVDNQKLMTELKERDTKDFTRQAGPLKQADDAIFIDSTNLSVSDTASLLLTYINKKHE